MPRERVHKKADESGYKYPGYTADTGQWVSGHVQCEEEGDHEVHPLTWPPQRLGNEAGDPSMSLRCVLCGCHLTVYEKHATGSLPGVKVVTPEPHADVRRRREVSA